MKGYRDILVHCINKIASDPAIGIDKMLDDFGIPKESRFFSVIKEKLVQFQLKTIKIKYGDIEYKYRFDEKNRSLFIIITSKCDHSCCFCDRSRKEMKEKGEVNETTAEEIRSILLINGGLNFSEIIIGGDEPLSNKNIIVILSVLDDMGKKITLYTSLSRDITFIKEFKSINTVVFPVYGSNAYVHDGITGVSGSYDLMLQRKKWLIDNEYDININGLIIKKNQKDFKYLEDDINLNFLIPNSNFTNDFYADNAIDFEEMREIIANSHKILSVMDEISLPLCVLNSLPEKRFDEIINKSTRRNRYESKKITSPNASVFEKVKTSRCEKCSYSDRCDGYYKVHFDVFGEQECLPIGPDGKMLIS